MSNQPPTAPSSNRGGLFAAGGRFTDARVCPIMQKFNSSIGIDQQMWREDIEGSIAWSNQLLVMKIVTLEERDMLVSGLETMAAEWVAGTINIQPTDEDIHSYHERRLTALIGAAVGGKLHTGRSRNDQVATDTRLHLARQELVVLSKLLNAMTVGVAKAEEWKHILTTGYTHLQPAQPVRYSHWLLSHLGKFFFTFKGSFCPTPVRPIPISN